MCVERDTLQQELTALKAQHKSLVVERNEVEEEWRQSRVEGQALKVSSADML